MGVRTPGRLTEPASNCGECAEIAGEPHEREPHVRHLDGLAGERNLSDPPGQPACATSRRTTTRQPLCGLVYGEARRRVDGEHGHGPPRLGNGSGTAARGL